MKPYFEHPEKFHAELADGYERPFLFRRPKFNCWQEEGFFFVDRDGNRWRPARRPGEKWSSDGASVPYPLAWIPPFTPYRYRRAAMAIHDSACRDGWLETWSETQQKWVPTKVSRKKADSLLQQGVEADGGWAATRFGYWGGVRIGAGFAALGRWWNDK